MCCTFLFCTLSLSHFGWLSLNWSLTHFIVFYWRLGWLWWFSPQFCIYSNTTLMRLSVMDLCKHVSYLCFSILYLSTLCALSSLHFGLLPQNWSLTHLLYFIEDLVEFDHFSTWVTMLMSLLKNFKHDKYVAMTFPFLKENMTLDEILCTEHVLYLYLFYFFTLVHFVLYPFHFLTNLI
jgi:hypothetical protein